MDILAIYRGEGTCSLGEFPTADFGPYIWNCMSQQWLGNACDKYFWTEKEGRLWELWKKPSVPLHQRAVLMMTFDRAYICKRDFVRAMVDLEAFLRDFPGGRSVQQTWEEICSLLARAQYPALGFHILPLTSNPFEGTWDRGTQQYGPFDWTTAYDVYGMLNGVTRISRGVTQAKNQEYVEDPRTV
jgi:hypothetical protein